MRRGPARATYVFFAVLALASVFASDSAAPTPPSLTLEVIPDGATAASGEAVRYVVYVNNTGTEDATDVWVNGTLDPRLAYGEYVGPGTVTVAGVDVTVDLGPVPRGVTFLAFGSTADSLLGDGSVVAFPVTVEFSDGVGRKELAASAVVDVRAPRVTANLEFPATSVRPGDVVTFGVTVTNSGREPAKHVWVNESLHPALTFLDDTSGLPVARNGAHQSWHFLDVVPGEVVFNVTVQVDPRAVDDTVITHSISLEHSDGVGNGLARSRSGTVWFRVAGSAANNPWLWGSFAISATLVAGTWALFVRRRLRVEEIFLIHHSGVLLVHMSKSLKSDHDTDILSGMFTAIVSFVREALLYESKQELQALDLGRYRVHIRRGTHVYLALVHSGKPSRWMVRAAARAVAAIEDDYGDKLAGWDGDVRALVGIRDVLRGYFLSPTGPSRSARWLRALTDRIEQTFKRARPL